MSSLKRAPHSTPPWFVRTGKVLSFAHRGGAGLWPENTLFAFKNAQRLGCSALETDVHVTQDGHLVVCHDATLDRTTNGSGAIADHTLASIKKLDAAHFFELGTLGVYPLRGRGISIPTFDELARELPDINLNIDLKGGQRSPQLLTEAIDRHQLSNRILVASSNRCRLNKFRKLTQGKIPTSASTSEALLFLLLGYLGLQSWLRPRYDALQLPLRYGILPIVNRRLVTRAKAAKLPVHLWTLNDKKSILEGLATQADGLMSDYVDLLVSAVDETPPTAAAHLHGRQ